MPDTLFESFDASFDDWSGTYSPYSTGQTFTASSNHSLTSFDLKLVRVGTPGTATWAIFATSGGLPTGSALATGTFSANSITTDSAGEWVNIVLSSPINLISGTKYAIVITCGSNGSNTLHALRLNDGTQYTGGTAVNGDSSFTIANFTTQAVDLGFKIYGVASSQALTRTLSDSILNGASRTSTLGRVVGFVRTSSDSLLNGASRFATVSRTTAITRALSATILNAASRLATVGKGITRALSDSLMNAASRFSTVSRLATLTRGLADSITNGASRLAVVSRSGNFSRALTDSFFNASFSSRSLSLLSGYNGSIGGNYGYPETLPAVKPDTYVAQDICGLSANIDTIGYWNGSQWVTHICAIPALNNFSINSGNNKSLLIHTTTSANITINTSGGVILSRVTGIIKPLSESIMNAASRYALVSRSVGYLRAVSDSISNAASRLTTVAKQVGFVRSLSDSITNAASRLTTVAKVYGGVRSLSDSILIAAGRHIIALVKFPYHYIDKFTKRSTSYSDKYSQRGNSYTDKFTQRGTNYRDKFDGFH